MCLCLCTLGCMRGRARVLTSLTPMLCIVPCRPLCEGEAEQAVILRRSKDGSHVKIKGKHGEDRIVEYDGVFLPQDGQDEVFSRVGQPLVAAALAGQKCCLVAYGAAGSGKSYTLLGSGDTGAEAGVVPRALAAIWESSASAGLAVCVKMSLLRITSDVR